MSGLLSRAAARDAARRLLDGGSLLDPLRDKPVRRKRRKQFLLPRNVVEAAAQTRPSHDAFLFRQRVLPLFFRSQSANPGVLPCGGGILEDDRLTIEEPDLEGLGRPSTSDPIGQLIQGATIVGRAHRAGVVHADLKPAHVVATKQGVYVIDWDAAVVWRDFSRYRAIGYCGTPQYMAPEQASGTLNDISPQTDVFALGLLLYEILHDCPARRACSDLQKQLALARSYRVRCDPKVRRRAPLLTAVCERAASMDPARRYADATRFKYALIRATR